MEHEKKSQLVDLLADFITEVGEPKINSLILEAREKALLEKKAFRILPTPGKKYFPGVFYAAWSCRPGKIMFFEMGGEGKILDVSLWGVYIHRDNTVLVDSDFVRVFKEEK